MIFADLRKAKSNYYCNNSIRSSYRSSFVQAVISITPSEAYVISSIGNYSGLYRKFSDQSWSPIPKFLPNNLVSLSHLTSSTFQPQKTSKEELILVTVTTVGTSIFNLANGSMYHKVQYNKAVDNA